MRRDEPFLRAINRVTRQHRGDLPHDLRFGVGFGVVRRFTWPPQVHRRLWPIMASPNGRQWWTVAYGNSIFVGPLVLSWKSPADRQPEGGESR